ncbi:oxidoreductase C-terminal domain-containing protein [Amycolatopsis sp. DSM 110486]|uniref:oxidoreductase C-terminal domain-containing protein n=1 Tax=Amycolatopsis sp. DSM 110486 TaxID=2865832 RepID=UPI001C69E222|nr:oxidoreductase C-terminal domain-containing protein [Amycolatopsis sp. DSM 110486]QYN25560.1 hypothetical protein K1T34_25940 [Amycolatopsis sp. DSM 110486]
MSTARSTFPAELPASLPPIAAVHGLSADELDLLADAWEARPSDAPTVVRRLDPAASRLRRCVARRGSPGPARCACSTSSTPRPTSRSKAGARMRVEAWSNATEQGAAAARNLLAAQDKRQPFASVPYLWSDQYDTSIQFAGRPGSQRVPIVEADGPKPAFLVLTGEGGTLTGVLSVNSPRVFLRIRRMIKARETLADAADAARAFLSR